MSSQKEKTIPCGACGIETFASELNCVICGTAFPLKKGGSNSTRKDYVDQMAMGDSVHPVEASPLPLASPSSGVERCLGPRLGKESCLVALTWGQVSKMFFFLVALNCIFSIVLFEGNLLTQGVSLNIKSYLGGCFVGLVVLTAFMLFGSIFKAKHPIIASASLIGGLFAAWITVVWLKEVMIGSKACSVLGFATSSVVMCAIIIREGFRCTCFD